MHVHGTQPFTTTTYASVQGHPECFRVFFFRATAWNSDQTDSTEKWWNSQRTLQELCKPKDCTNSTRKQLFFVAHFHTVSCSHVQMLFPLLRPWREAKRNFKNDVFLDCCGFVAGTLRNTSASISADTARYHFLAQSYFMGQDFGSHPGSCYGVEPNASIQKNTRTPAANTTTKSKTQIAV